MVNPGDRVTVTRSTGGAAYGAAEADGVGFFWTPLWQSSGQPVNVVAGDTVAIYVNGAISATITPYAIKDQGGGIYWLYVYDNNYPGQARHIVFDTNADT